MTDDVAVRYDLEPGVPVCDHCGHRFPGAQVPHVCDWIGDICRDVAELPDRTSPEDAPDMMLVTAQELQAVIERNVPALRVERDSLAAQFAGLMQIVDNAARDYRKNFERDVLAHHALEQMEAVEQLADDIRANLPASAKAMLDVVEAVTRGAQENLPDLIRWIADRLVHVYGENPNVDYVLTLRERADRIDAALSTLRGV